MRLLLCCLLLNLSACIPSYSQVDSTLLFGRTVYGAVDVRLSKGNGHNYYLDEGRTFSFREDGLGPTNTYLNMTAWDSSPYGEGNLREMTDTCDLFVMNYRLLPPQAYDPSVLHGYPLVVVMHGFLERGNCAGGDCYHATRNYSPNENVPPAPTDAAFQLLNNDYNLIHGGSNYLTASRASGGRLPNDETLPPDAFPGFIVFPQNLNGWDADAAEDVIRLVRLLIKRYHIDENRIYLNGISHGGHGAYEVMKRAPWMFAATALFSAADDASVIEQQMAGAIARVPLWIFQGALDANPTQEQTESYVDAFKKAGADIRYTLYPHLGHGTWNTALSEPDFFTWMLSKRRTDIHVFAGSTSICTTSESGTVLSLPKGFQAYEWEYNGQVIGDADLHTFAARQPGQYRARFRTTRSGASSEWSPWSEPVTLDAYTPDEAKIRQIGTLLLPDLNGNENARLESVNGHAYYYWRKDGNLLPLSGADSLRQVILKPETGNGKYSLIVAGYDECLSSESPSKHIIFKDAAPMNLSLPDAIKAEVISPSEILVNWTYASHEHSGFEIWRRKVTSSDAPVWEMVVLTEKAATAFSDKSVSPSSHYEYKIRAVNDSARSDYAPGGDTKLIVKTSADNEAPGPPGNVTATPAGVKAIRLAWTASWDNASVDNYLIQYGQDTVSTGSADTTLLLTDLDVNTVYSFKVRAKDQAGNISAASDAAEGDTYLAGLYYTHSTGAWSSLGAIDWSVQEFSGVVDDFSLAPKTQEDYFNFSFDGFLSISKPGVYQFRLTSDDGSSLSLNDTLLIKNDGIHNAHTVTGPIQILQRGPQRLTVRYFDYIGADTLLVEYKGPDTGREWIKMPTEVLTSQLIVSTEETVDNAFAFTVFPNPVAHHDDIHLQINSRDTGPVSVTIFDLGGSQLFRTDVDFREFIAIRPGDYIASGMYIISVAQGINVLNRKIVFRK